MRTDLTSQPNDWKGTLPVEWHIDRWQPGIQSVAVRRAAPTKPLPPMAFMRHPARRKKPFNLMKNSAPGARHRRAAFTLVELLTVIAIIAILAAMILPVVSHVMTTARKVQAKNDEQGIITAVESYDQDYGRFPVSTNEQNAAVGNDFTTGLNPTFLNSTGPVTYDSNSNVVAILMDMQTFPNGNITPDYNHVKNPKQTKYLNAKLSGFNPVGASPSVIPPPGVDQTGIYRDPWGDPYIITMDLNYDDQCSDIFYSKSAVSGNPPGSATGLNGLSDPGYSTNADNFQYPAKVMVWSAGPDRQYNSGISANTGVNKDNVLSWQ